MRQLIFVAVLALASSLTKAQTVTVDAERRPNIDFSHYKTYIWASQVDSKFNPEHYFQNDQISNNNDLVVKKQIQDAVGYALDGRGYTFTNQEPDLIISFQVLEKSTTVKAYTENGSDYARPGDVQTLGAEKDIAVNAGTIIVSLVDSKTDQAVWQGLASGLTSNNGIERQQGKIREAVNLIFNRYPYRADKF